MHEYVLTMLAAAAVTYLLTPLVRRFAIAIGAKHAARDRDVHVVPTPLLGGVAMYAGLAAGLLVADQLSGLTSVFTQTNMAKGLLLAGGLVVIMGFVDDRWGMGAISKLAGQVAAGVVLVWSGAEVTWLPEPGRGTLSLATDEQTAVTILVVVMTINAVNFIDGLDGLAAGIVGIGAAAFFIYYYTLTHRLGLPDQKGPALASAVLVGVCLGFLPHNFHRARIFMGDTGAMLIGLLLAYAPISSLAMLDPNSLTNPAAYANGTVNRFGAILPLLLPAAILLIPYADLLMAVVRRARAGTSPFAADKKHLHHRLLDIGHSHRASVLIMYLWAALFAGSVVWLSIERTRLIVLVAVTIACVLALLLVSMPRLRPWARAAAAAGGQSPAAADQQPVAGGVTVPAGPVGEPTARNPAGQPRTGREAGPRGPAGAPLSAARPHTAPPPGPRPPAPPHDTAPPPGTQVPATTPEQAGAPLAGPVKSWLAGASSPGVSYEPAPPRAPGPAGGAEPPPRGAGASHSASSPPWAPAPRPPSWPSAPSSPG